MNTVEINKPQRLSVKRENIITLPLGLLGFEGVKKYVLLANPQEEPFMWLQMLDDMDQSFLVLSPFGIIPDYQPDLAEEDVAFLGLEKPTDAIVLNIVTLHANRKASVNLRGPIVLNRNTLIGKQVIPVNSQDYALQHPLPVAEEEK